MNSLSDICPCETETFPEVPTNPPGRSRINYRVGDYVSFREALLRARAGEVELANWRPGAQGDLAVQMMEWWAYIADILTFYNERIANQAYLRTADLPESVQQLILLLGYRPRPGIGATGTLAALMAGITPLLLPQGFQIQSKPGPGQQPQIFELTADTQIQLPDMIGADPPPDPALLGSDGASVLLQGSITSIKPGDSLLLLEKGWTATDSNYAVLSAVNTSPQKDPRNNSNTLLTFKGVTNLPSGAQAADFNLLRSQQTARLWQYAAFSFVFLPGDDGSGTIHLDSVTRKIQVGDPILFTGLGSGAPPVPAVVTNYTESIFYANPSPPASDPSIAPPTPANIPIPILHSVITFQTPGTDLAWATESIQGTLLVNYAWQSAATLIPFPASTLASTSVSLQTPLPSSLLPLEDQDVLLSDANGNGVEAQATAGTATPSTLGLSDFSDTNASLAAPLNVMFDLLPVSRGASVTGEVLGSGDATLIVGQEFTLQKSPLTYLQSAASTSGSDYASTLRVWVNNVQWKEVPSFYAQPPDAQIFVTREDDQNITHVQFGDGVNGSRLPSGSDNVVASYRYGSGAESPAAGSLTVILKSWPGLKSIVNPVAVGGGADPDDPQKIKTYAPQSVLTFGRAISADDYEAIAAQAPGVTRARSYWVWDPIQQRMLVKVYVGDDANAANSANSALAGASDPNRPLKVLQASALPITMSLTLVINPSYITADVVAQVTAALIDPDTGMLGTNVVQIGQSIWQSQIYQACLSVAGVVAVHDLELEQKLVPVSFSFALRSFLPRITLPKSPKIFLPTTGCNCQDFRADSGEGAYFQLAAADLTISPEVTANGA